MAQRSALIGYTGFVGGNLKAQHDFTDFYNTKNIADIDGQEFDLVVSAATPAEMWKANAEPEADMASIQALMDHLATIKAKQFVLISTICNYANPIGVDEDSGLDTPHATPYGQHRARLEQFCREHFDNLLIARLPGLFGAGLKKNVIYDFIHHNNVDRVDSRGIYQFYNLGRIWADIQTALGAHLTLVNFAVEPTRVADVAREAFGLDFNQHTLPDDKLPNFDMRTKYGDIYGQSGPYLSNKAEVLADIRAFVKREQAALAQAKA
jgi:nucleoside-diphosphate-sugar epimerase